MSQSNVELARRGFAAIASGDLEIVAELLDPNVRWHGGDPNWAGACTDRGQALAWMRQALVRRAGRPPKLVEVLDAGDRVVVIMQPEPTADEPLPGRTANVATFRDGRVVEVVHYADASEAIAAAGVNP